MELRKILKEHQKYTTTRSLKNNLGDGFLITHNPIYRNVRKSVLKAGFKLNSKPFYDYDVLSLTQLPKILSKKTIPYSNNVNALLEIEAQAPGAFGLAEVPPLKANYLMHESAHAVARALKPKALKTSKKQELILNTLLEESFANACECLSNLDSLSELHDEFLFKNSYIMEKPKDRATLLAAEKRVGRGPLFRLMVIAYLHSNFLKTRIDEVQFDRVFQIAGISPEGDLTVLKKAFQIGLNLDPGFTIFTNSFCFRLMGFKGRIYDFLEFDFLGDLEKKKPYQQWFRDLESVILL